MNEVVELILKKTLLSIIIVDRITCYTFTIAGTVKNYSRKLGGVHYEN